MHKVMKSYIAAGLMLNLALVPCSDLFAADVKEQHRTDEAGLPYVQLEAVKDFFSLAVQARQSEKIIMLEVTASYCSYCGLLEEEIIKPMKRSGDYEQTVLIRQLAIDSFYTVKDFADNETTPASLAQKYKVKITPTLLFLDANGNEVAERILGVYSLDFYGAYVDAALATGLKVIREVKPYSGTSPLSLLGLNYHATRSTSPLR
jgi:thioredoxin-related protein